MALTTPDAARAVSDVAAAQIPALDAFIAVCDRPIIPPAKPKAALAVRQALRNALAALCKGKRGRAVIKANGCRVRVTAPQAGKVTLRASVTRKVRHGKRTRTRTITVLTGSHTFKKAGQATLRAKLTKQGRALLRGRKGKVKLRLSATFTDTKHKTTRVAATRSVRRR